MFGAATTSSTGSTGFSFGFGSSPLTTTSNLFSASNANTSSTGLNTTLTTSISNPIASTTFNLQSPAGGGGFKFGANTSLSTPTLTPSTTSSLLQPTPKSQSLFGGSSSITLTTTNNPVPSKTVTNISSLVADDNSVLTFRHLLDVINKFSLEMDELEKVFSNQAAQIQQWDIRLHENSKALIKANSVFQEQREKHLEMEYVLDYVTNQERELDFLIDSFEKLLSENRTDGVTDLNRSFYKSAETVNSKLQKMKEDLEDINENLNVKLEKRTEEEKESSTAVITKILNLFICALESFDDSITQLENQTKKDGKKCDRYDSPGSIIRIRDSFSK